MQDFWNNISRYPRFFVTITLGVLLTLISPLLPLYKRPSTAIATTGLILAALAFIALTLRAMLGLGTV
jgi:Protein of unknown function (DUF751)